MFDEAAVPAGFLQHRAVLFGHVVGVEADLGSVEAGCLVEKNGGECGCGINSTMFCEWNLLEETFKLHLVVT